MSTQQTDALQCAADLEYSIPRHRIQDAFILNAYKALKMVRTQHARIAELESQLAQRFDAADMATAAAQGFRVGATAPAQPVAEPARPIGYLNPKVLGTDGKIDAHGVLTYSSRPCGSWTFPFYAAAPTAPADSVQEDAALWHWLAEYLVGTRTDLDDEIVASKTVNDLRQLVKAAIKQGEKQ